MQNVISSTRVPGLVITDHHQSIIVNTNVFTRFFSWCASQQDNRFMWLAITLFGLVGLALPVTLYAIVNFGGNNFGLWIVACIINVPSLALNLAAQPTRITLPALFLAWIVDALIILGTITLFIIGR